MNYLIDKTTFSEYCHTYPVVPVILRRPLELDILEYVKQHCSKYKLLLHSPKRARYSFYAIQIHQTLIGNERGLEETIHGNEDRVAHYEGEPLSLLESKVLEYKGPQIHGAPPFYGGFVGFLSYDVARSIEKLPNDTVNDIDLPLFMMSMVTDGIAIDHESNELYIFANRIENESYEELVERIGQINKSLDELPLEDSEIDLGTLQLKKSDVQGKSLNLHNNGSCVHSNEFSDQRYLEASFTEEEFCHAVDRIIEYIKAGDVFQVNLSLRQGMKTDQSPFSTYCKLVEKNPSPYMSYVETPDFTIVSSSPELLIKVKDDVLETRPIAGTRSRGETVEQEEELMNDLLTNEKELAEHIMLVDLERNDLGRVSEYGSVEVNELLVLEKYSHVIHLVSNVRGKLRKEKNLFDVIRAVFPGGTITGAPKVRTMEIIEELEPVKRGIYTGSIGWLGFQQEMELNIVIRTAIFKHGWVFVQAGAGIVYDSIPKREYKESLKKARALWDVLRDN